MRTVIHWFRRDLRISDNTALCEAAKRADHVIPVFIFEDAFRTGPDVGAARLEFLLQSVESLRKNLAELGHVLVTRCGTSEDILPRLCRETGAEAVFANKRDEPYAQRRDERITGLLHAVDLPGYVAEENLGAGGGIFWLSRIPVDGTYLGNLLAPLVVMGVGLGLLYAGVQTAANAGVREDQAGLAAALITASFQLGSALGLAVFSGIATSRTSHLLAAHTPPPEALTAGFQRALLVSALCLVAAGAIALRASNTRGEPAATPGAQQNLEPSYDPA